MNTLIERRVSELERGMLDIFARNVLLHERSTPSQEYEAIRQRVVGLGNEVKDDDTLSCRLLSLMLMCARLSYDIPTLKAYTEQALRILGGSVEAKTLGDAYLLLGLFVSTRHPEFRTMLKVYRQQHPDIPDNLRRFMGIAKKAKVRKTAGYTKMATDKIGLVAESADAEMFMVHTNQEIVNWHTDGQQAYRLVTLGKAIGNPSAFQQMKDGRRPEYTPDASCSVRRLSALAGMAIARMDPEQMQMAFDALRQRFDASADEEEREQTLTAMYHAAGCDSNLLMVSLKQQCDALYDRLPSPQSYPLRFYRYAPMPGRRTIDRRNPGCRRWYDTLKQWADELVAADCGVWKAQPLHVNFMLHRYLCQTGYLIVAHDDRRLANSYRNYVNSGFFDAFLQLVSGPQPDTLSLVACYQALRELKYDIAGNEQHYQKLFRAVALTQASLPKASDEWLQLEEITTDYRRLLADGTRYKLVCPSKYGTNGS